MDAAACVEESGLTTTDDLFHGLGMGYLDPVGVSPSRTPYTEPRGDLRDAMSIVIQPNVTTTDHRAGVQTGQMIIVRPSGFEDLHHLQGGTGDGRMTTEQTTEQDVLVREAISHWAPRFTTNGVAVADFNRVTSSVMRWEDWADAWAAAGDVHAELGREAMAEGRMRSAGTHLSTAAVYYHFGKFVFVDYPDTMKPCSSAGGCSTDGGVAVPRSRG